MYYLTRPSNLMKIPSLHFAILALEKEQKPEIEKIEADFITKILDKFVMNVTALNNYLKCPLQFYFNNLVRVPSGKSEATEFGSAVHYALQMLFQKMQKNEQVFPDTKEFMSDFKWYMTRHRENFTKEQFARRMEQGEQVLQEYYNRYINEVEQNCGGRNQYQECDGERYSPERKTR